LKSYLILKTINDLKERGLMWNFTSISYINIQSNANPMRCVK
jgi:hypothetical protein